VPTTVDAASLEPRISSRLGAAGVTLPPPIVIALAHHLALTLKWAKSMSLTSIRSIDESIERHILESVIAAQTIDASKGPLLDIGSGNGYPAIPALLLHPALRGILLEPHLRRSIFLGQVAVALELNNVEVRRERLAAPGDLLPFAPLGTVTMRAVAAVNLAIQACALALGPGGRLLLFLSDEGVEQALESLPAGLALLDRVALPDRQKTRLIIFERVT
jgi:16S rRNA (guanine527-N7)-methyltransferase